MFSKAKRFDPAKNGKKQSKIIKPIDSATVKDMKSDKLCEKPKTANVPAGQTNLKDVANNWIETPVECNSLPSINKKPFVTPKPTKSFILRSKLSAKKETSPTLKLSAKKPACKPSDSKAVNDVASGLELAIRNKNATIAEYRKQIEELQIEIKNIKSTNNAKSHTKDVENLTQSIKHVAINTDGNDNCLVFKVDDYNNCINELQNKIHLLEGQCAKLELESTTKQLELASLEEVITIRDSLCKDLQEKLTAQEFKYNEICERLEMVKGHHALALQANESIRREYKIELESLKNKVEEEKHAMLNKSKAEQETIKNKYLQKIESLKMDIEQEKNDLMEAMHKQLEEKDEETKIKIERLEETSHEKLRLCEVQFEQRIQEVQDHWSQQNTKLISVENELSKLKYALNASEEQNKQMKFELNVAIDKYKVLKTENIGLTDEIEDLREIGKRKNIDFENQLNKLTLEVDNAIKEKRKYETALKFTREVVDVLSNRLRESDNDVETLENKVKDLDCSKQALEEELSVCKGNLHNIMLECNEYKSALVEIMKSKAVLAQQHNIIMEHNVNLLESLQNVEKEAFKELGAIKNELIDDVEMMRMESATQIQQLKDEVQRKQALAVLAKEQAGEAVAAAEQSRLLLAQASQEFTRLENENQKLKEQIQDQQSLVVELSLLRQENEELSMTVAKQASLIDKIKVDPPKSHQNSPKSPSLHKKSLKMGKENAPLAISPLRERNFQNPVV